MNNVYVATWFENARYVREHVYPRLLAYDLNPTSNWVNGAEGPDDLEARLPWQLEKAANENDECIDRSNVMFVLAAASKGGEMFAEVARALLIPRIPVVWLGRVTLSAFRPGVLRARDLEHGIALVRAFVDRGQELARRRPSRVQL